MQRFWDKVDRDSGECWTWKASLSKGYGMFWYEGRTIKAHRFAYELTVGPIPDGLALDHLCRNRACVNPSHLEPVTWAENSRRGELGRVWGDIQLAKTHCPQGHPYDEENTYICSRGFRYCKICQRESTRRSREGRSNAAHA